MFVPKNLIWPKDASTAIAEQQKLRANVRLINDYATDRLIAGIDVSYDLKTNLTHAVIAVLQKADWQIIETVHATAPTDFPYISGLLSFREIPALLLAYEKLKTEPDILMVDGMGVAHPRRLGIAAHLGVLLDKPSIGVGKSRLVGKFEGVGPDKGDWSALMDKGERIGSVLRSKPRTNPLFISAGHRLDQDTTLRMVIDGLKGYRLPEPTRLADKISKLRPEPDLLI